MTNLAIALILSISVITDLRNRKILNIVTLPAIFVAIIYHFFTTGMEGFLFSGQGFLVGLGLLFIPFLLGGIGAGDVKLLAAIGAWSGTIFVLYTGIYAGIMGGLIAMFILIKRKQLRFTITNMLTTAVSLKGTKGSLHMKEETNQVLSIPYAIPIAIGAMLTILMETLL
ncbi:A24 family peptidase [Terrihalobacillus insolitus]|uniref:A24 family peptidase n=1 Tax=Terrihalobacillus insolitus TaxID=2950438 RepID=UPI0023412AED|nr:prepilin peptidase [Terrihalobacillus insolitus]MDC3413853.1 prepilin peptidase [Terrihalobacillus insolitus]